MASTVYPKAREALLSGAIDLTTDTVKAVLVDYGYTYSAAHDFYDDVSTFAAATPQTLTSKTVTLGVFDAADVTFTAVAGILDSFGDPGGELTGIVIFIDTGVAGTSRLLAYVDTGTGLPVVPDGGDITVTWDAGSSKIFAL